MSRFISVVRVKVKAGHKPEVLQQIESFALPKGCLNYTVVDTGEETLCSMMTWSSQDALTEARTEMISNLDTIREHLVELSPALGVTDPVSGPVTYSSSAA